jgi:hypothetical protein
MDEITGEYRRPHNKKFYALYSSPNIIRKINKNAIGGACGTHGRQKRCMQGFGGETCRKQTTWNTQA